jgi:hypothetical protein
MSVTRWQRRLKPLTRGAKRAVREHAYDVGQVCSGDRANACRVGGDEGRVLSNSNATFTPSQAGRGIVLRCKAANSLPIDFDQWAVCASF